MAYFTQDQLGRKNFKILDLEAGQGHEPLVAQSQQKAKMFWNKLYNLQAWTLPPEWLWADGHCPQGNPTTKSFIFFPIKTLLHLWAAFSSTRSLPFYLTFLAYQPLLSPRMFQAPHSASTHVLHPIVRSLMIFNGSQVLARAKEMNG